MNYFFTRLLLFCITFKKINIMISEFVKNIVELINEDAKKHDFTKNSPAPNINGFLVRTCKSVLHGPTYFVHFYDESVINNSPSLSLFCAEAFSHYEVTEAEYLLIQDAISDWDKCKKEFRKKFITEMIDCLVIKPSNDINELDID